MDLYLVRHAIAEERNDALWPDDSERPLTRKGIKSFKKAAQGVSAVAPEVDIVLTSPYRRALHTAFILHRLAGWPAPAICEELAQREPGVLVHALEPYEDVKSLAVVGHEPYLSRFAAALLGGSAPWGELKKGGVVKLELPVLSLTAGAKLVWYLPPGVLRKLV